MYLPTFLLKKEGGKEQPPARSAAAAPMAETDLVAVMDAFADSKAWTPALNDVLGEVSSSGQSRFAWEQLKPVIGAKLEQVCAEYHEAKQDLPEPYDEMLKRLQALLAEFPNAPFTVQRLCELLLDPHRIYATSTRKVRAPGRASAVHREGDCLARRLLRSSASTPRPRLPAAASAHAPRLFADAPGELGAGEAAYRQQHRPNHADRGAQARHLPGARPLAASLVATPHDAAGRRPPPPTVDDALRPLRPAVCAPLFVLRPAVLWQGAVAVHALATHSATRLLSWCSLCAPAVRESGLLASPPVCRSLSHIPSHHPLQCACTHTRLSRCALVSSSCVCAVAAAQAAAEAELKTLVGEEGVEAQPMEVEQ